MKILNRLPIYDSPESLPAPAGAIVVRPGQIVFRASVTPHTVKRLSPSESTFPVILDTGNNFTFAIRQPQVELWLTRAFDEIGDIRVNKQTILRYKANLWIYPNVRGTHLLANKEPFLITMKEGMAVYPDDQNPTRIPIMGMRAITTNKLKLFVNGETGFVDLKQGWL